MEIEMLTGKYTVTDIPTREDVEKTKRRFLRSNLSTEPQPEITEEGTGPWTVIAIFPGEGNSEEVFNE
jgi:hypothetical protein